MRIRFLILLAAALPFSAMAQNSYSNAPMLMGPEGNSAAVAPAAAATVPTPLPPNFPDWAVTKAAENTTGQHVTTPATPASPSAPSAPTPGEAPTAAAPASPASPPSPVSKLWPRDTIPIFMQSCVGFHAELIPACNCVITSLMLKMPHDEFLAMSEAGTIEQDPRLTAIRTQCVSTPRPREQ